MRRLLIVLASVLLCAGCGPTVDLTQGLKVGVLTSGWYDMGIVNGQNKLVPMITLKLENTSGRRLSSLQINALFRQITSKDEWGNAFLPINETTGLAVGATQTITIRSNLGYTGSDSRLEMLANSHFVDAKVEVFGKYGSVQWARIGEYPIERKLIESTAADRSSGPTK
jgi:hypothetical protein